MIWTIRTNFNNISSNYCYSSNPYIAILWKREAKEDNITNSEKYRTDESSRVTWDKNETIIIASAILIGQILIEYLPLVLSNKNWSGMK